jgi:hypothetical protein
MNKKVPKGMLNLADLVGKRQLTTDGARWLTLAVDPFHDWNVPIAGYPDADCSNTVVQCFQYQADLAAPAAVTWDAHIYVNQDFSTAVEEEYKADASADNINLTGAAPGVMSGILKITTCLSGQLLAPTKAAAYAPTNGTYASLGTYADLAKPSSRIVGMGFEIINTSAEIYKQGTITAYKMPQVCEHTSQLYINAAGTADGILPVRMIREAPSTAAIASNLHGTVAWEAAKGAYVVCTQGTVENPITGVSRNPVLRSETGTIEEGAYLHGTRVGFTPVALPALATQYEDHKHIPFNTHGVMVTGLNANSTLRVRLRVYVERAPGCGTADQGLAVLATPSAVYDTAALKVYSQVAARMPVAVPVDMNAWGDWWRVISAIIKSVAVPVGTALGGPVGGTVGAGVAGIAMGLDQVFDPRPDSKGRGPVAHADNPATKPSQVNGNQKKTKKANTKDVMVAKRNGG